VETETLIRTLKGHSNRVSSSAFTYGMLFTGSKDTKIIGHDYRSQNNIVMKFQGHRGEVCGLKHDACGLASGSNDNQAIIWDLNTAKIRYQLLGHKAAVKALAWCPWQRNLLATGGGSSDQTMRFWNIETGKIINTVNTESQVCSLIWNKNDKEILSSHGFS
jgi:cell division cycle protein 20 (cofactor of APC complex)